MLGTIIVGLLRLGGTSMWQNHMELNEYLSSGLLIINISLAVHLPIWMSMPHHLAHLPSISKVTKFFNLAVDKLKEVEGFHMVNIDDEED